MEPRASTTVTPLSGAVSSTSGVRVMALIGNFYYTDLLGTGTSAVGETGFDTTKHNVKATDFRLFLDSTELVLGVGATPAPGEYVLTGTDVVGGHAHVVIASDLAVGAKLTARYRYDEDADGATIFNKVFNITPRELRAYESVFGTIQEYNDLMLAANLAKSYGISRMLLVPTNNTIGISGTPTSPDISDALEALQYENVQLIVALFNNDSVLTALLTHVDYMSEATRAQYRVGFGGLAATTVATMAIALPAWNVSYRMNVVCAVNGNCQVLLGSTWYDKPSCFLAVACAAKYAAFAYLAKPLTRQTLPYLKLTATMTLDEREQLQDLGGTTFRILGTDTVQVAWSKSTTNSGNPDQEETSVVLVSDYVRTDIESTLDAANTGKVIGVPSSLGGVTEGDLVATTNAKFANYKGRGLVVDWRNAEFVQSVTEPRRFDGTVEVKWPYPANWTTLNLVSYV